MRICYVVFFITSWCFSQTALDSIQIKKIDSTLDSNYTYYEGNVYSSDLACLKQSKKINYIKGELLAYLNLFFQNSRKRNLDSALYYSDQFEFKEKLLDEKDRNLINRYHYADKAFAMVTFFGLQEQSFQACLKGLNYIDDPVEGIPFKNIIGRYYMFKEQYDKALEIMIPLVKDTAYIEPGDKIRLMSSIASVYQFKKEPEKSHPILMDLLSFSKKMEYIEGLWWIKNNLTYDYYLFGDHKKAIDSLLVVRDTILKLEIKELLPTNSEFLSIYYDAYGNTENAIKYMEEATASPELFQELPELYSKLAGYYKTKKDYLSVVDVYGRREKAIDSIRDLEKFFLVRNSDANVRLIKEKQLTEQRSFENQLLLEKNRKQRLWFIVLGALFISTVLSIISFFLYRKYSKGKKEITILKTNEKKILEEQIKLRENELLATVMHVSQTIDQFSQVQIDLDKFDGDDLNVKKAKQEVNTILKSSTKLNLLSQRIESQYPGITEELKNQYPNLSSNDIKHCLMMKLKLSLKESSQLLNVSISAVKMARQRLRKKMDLDQGISLSDHLEFISQ